MEGERHRSALEKVLVTYVLQSIALLFLILINLLYIIGNVSPKLCDHLETEAFCVVNNFAQNILELIIFEAGK